MSCRPENLPRYPKPYSYICREKQWVLQRSENTIACGNIRPEVHLTGGAMCPSPAIRERELVNEGAFAEY